MHGLNKTFLADPAAFLRDYLLRIRNEGENDENDPNPMDGLAPNLPNAVARFDLCRRPYGAEIVPWRDHPKTTLMGTQRPITAFWLPYGAGVAKRVVLGNQANYLITPMLDGCYFGVGNGQAVHIAGDIEINEPNTARMRAIATERLGAAPGIAFDSQNRGRHYTIVGKRVQNIWSWWIQGHTSFTDNGPKQRMPVVPGQQSVIQLIDMTYG